MATGGPPGDDGDPDIIERLNEQGEQLEHDEEQSRLFQLIAKAQIEQPGHSQYYVPVLEWYDRLEETSKDSGEYKYEEVLRFMVETNKGWMNARSLYALYNHYWLCHEDPLPYPYGEILENCMMETVQYYVQRGSPGNGPFVAEHPKLCRVYDMIRKSAKQKGESVNYRQNYEIELGEQIVRFVDGQFDISQLAYDPTKDDPFGITQYLTSETIDETLKQTHSVTKRMENNIREIYRQTAYTRTVVRAWATLIGICEETRRYARQVWGDIQNAQRIPKTTWEKTKDLHLSPEIRQMADKIERLDSEIQAIMTLVPQSHWNEQLSYYARQYLEDERFVGFLNMARRQEFEAHQAQPRRKRIKVGVKKPKGAMRQVATEKRAIPPEGKTDTDLHKVSDSSSDDSSDEDFVDASPEIIWVDKKSYQGKRQGDQKGSSGQSRTDELNQKMGKLNLSKQTSGKSGENRHHVRWSSQDGLNYETGESLRGGEPDYSGQGTTYQSGQSDQVNLNTTYTVQPSIGRSDTWYTPVRTPNYTQGRTFPGFDQTGGFTDPSTTMGWTSTNAQQGSTPGAGASSGSFQHPSYGGSAHQHSTPHPSQGWDNRAMNSGYRQDQTSTPFADQQGLGNPQGNANTFGTGNRGVHPVSATHNTGAHHTGYTVGGPSTHSLAGNATVHPHTGPTRGPPTGPTRGPSMGPAVGPFMGAAMGPTGPPMGTTIGPMGGPTLGNMGSTTGGVYPTAALPWAQPTMSLQMMRQRQMERLQQHWLDSRRQENIPLVRNLSEINAYQTGLALTAKANPSKLKAIREWVGSYELSNVHSINQFAGRVQQMMSNLDIHPSDLDAVLTDCMRQHEQARIWYRTWKGIHPNLREPFDAAFAQQFLPYVSAAEIQRRCRQFRPDLSQDIIANGHRLREEIRPYVELIKNPVEYAQAEEELLNTFRDFVGAAHRLHLSMSGALNIDQALAVIENYRMMEPRDALRIPSDYKHPLDNPGKEGVRKAAGLNAIEVQGTYPVTILEESKEPDQAPPSTSAVKNQGVPRAVESTERSLGYRSIYYCEYCKIAGHTQARCRAYAKSIGREVPEAYPCKKCGAKGDHWEDNCPQATPKKLGGWSSTRESVKCYNCQGYGHLAKDCSSPKRPRGESGGSASAPYSRPASATNGGNQGN
jgi:hypothetical protein